MRPLSTTSGVGWGSYVRHPATGNSLMTMILMLGFRYMVCTYIPGRCCICSICGIELGDWYNIGNISRLMVCGETKFGQLIGKIHVISNK